MRSSIPLFIAALALGSQAALAQQPAAVAVTSSPGKASVAATVEATATVTAIDPATRTISLKGSKGNEFEIVAGDAVKNFAQIKVGDVVAAKYVEALSLELKKALGPADAKQVAGAAGAKAGSKPAGILAKETTILADVVAIDAATQVVSLKGPKGRIVELKVRNPDQFKLVKVGDQVEAVYTQALAMAVSPAKK